MPDNNYEMKIVFAGDPQSKLYLKLSKLLWTTKGMLGIQKKAKTQGNIMLQFFKQIKNSLKKLELILDLENQNKKINQKSLIKFY